MKQEEYETLLDEVQILSTTRLTLRPLRMDDLDAYDTMCSDPHVTEYLTFETYTEKEAVAEFLQTVMIPNKSAYCIALKKTDQCIGVLDVRPILEHSKFSFGFMLAKEHWGKGYMTEALSQVLKVIFTVFKANRVESTHYRGNEGSGRVMEHCGMQREGVGRQALLIKGVYRDVVHYGILRDDYKG